MMRYSYIKSITVENFRAINSITFNPGKRLTLIAGKNGTAKSTILGMVVHPFSFNPEIVLGSDYTKANISKLEDRDLAQKMQAEIDSLTRVQGKNFESKVSNHFKLTEVDVKGARHAKIEFHNQLSNSDLDIEIESNDYQDRKTPRLVTRKRLPAPAQGEKDTRSSNEIFPVVYLSLKRVLPIVETTHNERILELTPEESRYLKRLYDQILLNTYPNKLTSVNEKDKTSLSFIKEDMNIHMISSGEDNVGQILEALLSFRRLKNTYNKYSGGILVIDELDATLYPGAQLQLLKVLLSEAKSLGLQLFMSSHSMFLIEHALSLNEDDGVYKGEVEVLMLKKQNQTISVIKDFDRKILWQDLHEELQSEVKDEKIRLYFEDKEAEFVFSSIVTERKITKRIDKVDVSLGCDKYIELFDKKIPEFVYMSCVVLDGDQEDSKIKNIKNFVMLPSENAAPPERMIYNYISNPESDFWRECEPSYTHQILLTNPHNMAIREILDGDFDEGNRKASGSPYYKKKPRDVWKMWFKEEKKRWKTVRNNPFRHWAKKNQNKVDLFKSELNKSLNFIALKNGMPPFD